MLCMSQAEKNAKNRYTFAHFDHSWQNLCISQELWVGTTEEKKDNNYDEKGFEPTTFDLESDNLPRHYRLAHALNKITMVYFLIK